MSRITTDLFEITELLHHGPENIILSVLKIAGALIILLGINGYLSLAAFVVLPPMFVFAFFLNRKMRATFRKNRQRIAEINGRLGTPERLKVRKRFFRREKFPVFDNNKLRYSMCIPLIQDPLSKGNVLHLT